jgi:Alw26I/Eco31I/Esp3I family type II restriction endonuclease
VPIKYGGRGRNVHPAFIQYMKQIVKHPNYKNMPWAIDEEGKIRWNAPSYRPPGGQWSDLHDQRLEWWRSKACQLEIPISGKWIAIAAKRTHPFKEKPCQTCGRVMSIDYRYPTKRTLQQINDIPGISAPFLTSDYKDIIEISKEVYDQAGTEGLAALSELLRFPGSEPPPTLKSFLEWLGQTLIPSEPRGVLSPGAMADPPDRLDGFHTYNMCCRQKEDTGRTPTNLKTYLMDRRTFEFWCEGDWAAADYLMKQTVHGRCQSCGKVLDLTADHVGPLSLGFCHRPEFRALCKACNSARNNRLNVTDVNLLLNEESRGEKVISWQARYIWDGFKKRVLTQDDALKLTAMMRVAQHHYLTILHKIKDIGCTGYLQSILHSEYALNKYELEGFTGQDFSFTKLVSSNRHETYASMKVERVRRIALDSLDEYVSKVNRRVIPVLDEQLSRIEHEVLEEAQRSIKTEKYDNITARLDEYNKTVAKLLIGKGVPRGYDALKS